MRTTMIDLPSLQRRPFAVVAGVVLALLAVAPALAQSRSGTTSAGLYYEMSGRGEPVVLLHAFSMDRRMWEPQIAVLEKEFTVIRYDQRGHGRSPVPNEPYTPQDDLLSVLQAAGVERASLVGLSSGAQQAVDFAITHPDRVTRLVLASPGLGGYVPKAPMTWMQPVLQAVATGDGERTARLWAETPIMTLYGDTTRAPQLREIVMGNSRIWTVRSNPARPMAPPAIGRLAEITAPTLIVTGSRDLPHILEVGGLLSNGIKGARLVTIPGAGHILNLDAAEAFNGELLRFLRNR